VPVVPRRVSVVPHTHWDREWYAPFQSFRLRLVDLLDDLLPRLEADPSFAHFMLDGQMAMVDDYLAVRPEAEPVVRRLAAAGRLAVGPWYVLPDEFLVSGETLVRNLQLGIERAAAFGGAMEVGYLPDMFGHVAQMPQLLRQFGFEHAVVWRGVPAAVDRTAFRWVAPDGSEIRAEYLPGGYGNGAVLPDDAKALVGLVADFEDRHAGLLHGDDPLLWMNGTDHLAPRPWVGRVVAEANDVQDRYELAVTSLAAHLAGTPTDGLPTWEGELRSGARANLLMGVASNRVDVKQAAARAERALERLAEPLSALFLPPDRWPAALLADAWLAVIRNAAHDSICACSHDDVVDAVLVRYAEAGHVAGGLARRALRAVGAAVSAAGPVVVNPAAHARGGVVEVDLPGADPPPGTQLVDATPAEEVLHRVTGWEGPAVLERELEIRPDVTAVDVDEGDGGEVVVTLTVDPAAGPRDRRGAARQVAALSAERPDGPFRVVVRQPPTVRVLARVAPVDGFGWAAWSGPDEAVGPITATATTLANGLVTVSVDPVDGTFSLDGHGGLGRLVDGGDAGDTYNWSPPAPDRIVDRPDGVDVTVAEDGPVRGRLVVERRYRWPHRVEAGRRVGERAVTVTSTLELLAGERFVRVGVALDNQCRDHRLRAHFPLPRRAATTTAECAFGTVERGRDAEGGPTERALATWPSRRFVTAGGLTVAHEGLLEHELVDGGSTLAVTLLRCTGLLSNGPMTMRPLPAGPVVPAEGAQLAGPRSVRYAVATGDVDPWTMADDAFLPLQVARAAGTGTGPARGSALTVTGAQVSAVVRRGRALEVRVFNPTPDPATVALDGRRGWLVDLRGRPERPFDGHFELGPWRIATARLAEP
jgi:mannosylglycerate hydrolase